MPELPDLEVFADNLNHKLKGKRLQGIPVLKNARVNASPAALKKSLEGRLLNGVHRQGKELRLFFKNKNIPGIHFMLRGKFFWFGDKNAHNHTPLELLFAAEPGIVGGEIRNFLLIRQAAKKMPFWRSD